MEQGFHYILDVKKNGFAFTKSRLRKLFQIYRRYKFGLPLKNVQPICIQLIDGKIYHGGIADRINSICTGYAFAKATNSNYKLIHIHSFDIGQYLRPNVHNWAIDHNEVCYNFWNTQVVYYKDRITHKVKVNRRLQQHCYIHCNSFDSINRLYGKSYSYRDLFNELFIPTPRLQQKIDSHTKNLSLHYESLVFRFQNLLGDFYEGPYPTYNKKSQQKLIALCMAYLTRFCSKNQGKKILVTSDSSKFLNIASSIKNVYVVPGKRIHVQYGKDSDFEDYAKSFVDFLMLSKSERIELVVAKDMYKSGFPRMAARLGEIPFEIVNL